MAAGAAVGVAAGAAVGAAANAYVRTAATACECVGTTAVPVDVAEMGAKDDADVGGPALGGAFADGSIAEGSAVRVALPAATAASTCTAYPPSAELAGCKAELIAELVAEVAAEVIAGCTVDWIALPLPRVGTIVNPCDPATSREPLAGSVALAVVMFVNKSDMGVHVCCC